MFEDSTFESTGSIRTRSRGWMIATFTFNTAVLLALTLFPLLYPAALPRMVNSILMTVPPPQQAAPQPPPQRTVVRLTRATELMGKQLIAPRLIPAAPFAPTVPERLTAISAATWDEGPASGKNLGIFSRRPTGPAVRQQPQKKTRVSQGMMNGFLISKVIPQYPVIARAAGVEGTVVLQAIISRSGTIEDLRIVSGPDLLQRAAVDAVRQWRYRPYLLNGEPVEVETTVNVQFTMH